MTLGITTLNIAAIVITSLSITALSSMEPSLITFCITTQYNGTEHNFGHPRVLSTTKLTIMVLSITSLSTTNLSIMVLSVTSLTKMTLRQ